MEHGLNSFVAHNSNAYNTIWVVDHTYVWCKQYLYLFAPTNCQLAFYLFFLENFSFVRMEFEMFLVFCSPLKLANRLVIRFLSLIEACIHDFWQFNNKIEFQLLLCIILNEKKPIDFDKYSLLFALRSSYYKILNSVFDGNQYQTSACRLPVMMTKQRYFFLHCGLFLCRYVFFFAHRWESRISKPI